MNIVGMIPARSGSQGILDKNIRDFCGRPLISYAIEAALGCNRINKVCLNSDSETYLEIGRKFGAQPYLRPSEFARDDASMKSVVVDFINSLGDGGELFDAVAVLYPTYPLRDSDDIDKIIAAFESLEGCRSLVGLRKPRTHPYKCYTLEEQNHPVSVLDIDEDLFYRRQNYPRHFEITHWACVISTANLDRLNFQLVDRETFGYVITDNVRLADVDTPLDFEFTEFLYKKQENMQIEVPIPKRSSHELEERHISLPLRVTALVLDFDGVLTDNRVVVLDDGREGVICDRGDGLGLSLLRALQIPILVLSSETNSVVQARCDKLLVECIHGTDDKLAVLELWLRQHNLDMSGVIYVGNDINDLDCMQSVECGVAVADAYPEIMNVAKITLASSGGRGAVREIAELIQQRVELTEKKNDAYS